MRTARGLDYETKKEYQLLVVASDKAPNPRSTTLKITIKVKDRADSFPIFIQRQYEGNAPENKAGYDIVKVTVSIGFF